MAEPTREQFIAACKRVQLENPDSRNPIDPETSFCLYNKLPTDKTDAAEHCFLGMVLILLGQPLPDEGELPFPPSHHLSGIARSIQNIADRTFTWGAIPIDAIVSNYYEMT